jgi:hypothetical protein
MGVKLGLSPPREGHILREFGNYVLRRMVRPEVKEV